MAMTGNDAQMVEGPLNREFARFVLPTVAGMLAVSSASIIDGVFIGKFAGATALAAVNLVMPLFAAVFGIMIMLTVGAAVIAGKFIGEGRFRRASDVFTKSVITVLAIVTVMSMAALAFPEQIVLALGAHGETVPLSAAYLKGIAWFFPALSVAVLLNQFARVDGRPGHALWGMVTITVANILLDALFIAGFGWGVTGAAVATGLAYAAGAGVLFYYFASSGSKLRIVRPLGSWAVVPKAAVNGFSEFLNETSGGLVIFLFNWILMLQAGAAGVAAFTIVNYLYYIGVLIFYGVSEGLTPLVSVNFGARKPGRISGFLLRAIGFNLVIGVALATALILAAEPLSGLFLKAGDEEALQLALPMIAIVWPVFLFGGVTIALTGYFTGMHCARQSAVIALFRSLLLPVGLTLLFWKTFGYMGAFYALPVAEALTLCIAVFLFWRRRPGMVAAKGSKPRKAKQAIAGAGAPAV